TSHKIAVAPCLHSRVPTPYPVRVLFRVSRPRPVRATVFIALLAVCVAFAVASPASAKPAKARKPLAKITVGDITMYKVGNDPQTFPADLRPKILAALPTYVTAAPVKPLQTGTVDDAALASTLGPAATQRASGSDRGTLVDEGIPKASSRIIVNTLPVKLT